MQKSTKVPILPSITRFGLFAAVSCITWLTAHSGNTRPIVGAIRWDAQVGDLYSYGTEENVMLSPLGFRNRVPFYAQVHEDGSVDLDATDPSYMEKEIVYASDSGLDYWAFLTYEDNTEEHWGYGLGIQLKNFLQSPNRDEINFTVILADKNNIGDNEAEWPRWFSRYTKYLKYSNYQTVLNGRPLVYTFRYADWDKSAKFLELFLKTCEESDLPKPYIVDLHWNNTLTAGADAMSSYANGVYRPELQLETILPYDEQIAYDAQKWKSRIEQGTPQIPIVTSGWDGRPRLAVRKDKETKRIYNPVVDTATPQKLAENLRNAIQFVEANPENCEANAILIYGWNEFSEGGYICPVLQEYGSTERLDAIRTVLDQRATACADPQAKPNILLILADDLGYEDLGCYGNTFHETPNIDHLAKKGVQLTRHYSAGAVCSPTRASIMTGNFPARIHVTEVYDWGFKTNLNTALICETDNYMDPSWSYLAKSLNSLGYATGMFGKWHLMGVSPEETGFNTVSENHPHPAGKWFDDNVYNDDNWKTEQITQDTLSFIEKSVKDKKPFFAYVSHNLPHVPWGTKSQLLEKYRNKLKSHADFQGAAYAGMIQQLDTSVGELIYALEDLNVLDNTLVIFTSDNGPVGHANTKLNRGKSYPQDGGIRVPFVAMWKGMISEGSTSEDLVNSADYFKTLYAVAGGNPDSLKNDVLDGENFLPVLLGNKKQTRRPMIFHFPLGRDYMGGWSAIIDWPYKYVYYWEGSLTPSNAIQNEKVNLLYNLREDEGEQNNLLSKLPGKSLELKTKLLQWLHDNDCQIPSPRLDTLTGKLHQAVVGVEQKAEYAKDWWIPRHKTILKRTRKGNVDLVFIGDSITQSWESSGRKIWEKYYANRNAVNMGFGGDKTQHVLWRIENGELDDISPKLVVINIGTNNSWDTNAQQSVDGVTEVVEKIKKKLPSSEILLLAIFPRGGPADPLRKINDMANHQLASLADDESIHFLDLSENFVNHDGTLRDLYLQDCVHLNEKGYETWARAMEPTLQEIISEKVTDSTDLTRS